MAFDVAPPWRYIGQQFVQRYTFFLLYPCIECILQGLLLLYARDAEEIEVTERRYR